MSRAPKDELRTVQDVDEFLRGLVALRVIARREAVRLMEERDACLEQVDTLTAKIDQHLGHRIRIEGKKAA